MVFYHGKRRRGGDKVASHSVIGINDANGRPFTRISTLWRQGFVHFHHELLAKVLPDLDIFDCSDWLTRMGGSPREFWPRHLALFICHGILFDNFHLHGHEARFTREVILPAVTRVNRYFGVAPIIVPMVEVERERDPYWGWYPGELEQEVKLRKLYGADGSPIRCQKASRGEVYGG